MIKIQRSELQNRINTSREALLDAIAGAPEDMLRQPNVYREQSVTDILGYLGMWGEMVNKGLREVQRRKKPMDLLRAVDNHEAFKAEAIAETNSESLDDLLFRLEDALFQLEVRLENFSQDDLNRPKRIRFLGNKPLWPFIAQITYENEQPHTAAIAAYVKRNL